MLAFALFVIALGIVFCSLGADPYEQEWKDHRRWQPDRFAGPREESR